MENLIQVMLVEDNREYREVVEFAFEKEPEMKLTWSFATAEMALAGFLSKDAPAPNVILLDLNLPGMSGLEAIPYFRKVAPHAKIIILSQSDAEAEVLKAIALGVSGYLLKSSSMQEIKDGIGSVHAGSASLTPKVAKYVLSALREKPLKAVAPLLLTEREQQILELLAQGNQKKEIAERLRIGYSTVDTHVRRIYEKLDVQNAPSAVRKAYQVGIFSINR